MSLKRLHTRIARTVIVLLCAGFIQTGLSAPMANAAAPIEPTISSITSGATSLTVNMVTTGIDATSWRWSISKRTGVSCANTYGDGVVQATGSLTSTISITGLTAGCTYSVKVAGYNGVIGDYNEAEKLVGAYSNGLNVYYKNEAGSSTAMTRVPFITGTCNVSQVSNINQDWGTSGPSGCNTDGFTGYYIGYIKAPFTGTVTFRNRSDDGFVLNIQGQNVIYNLVDQGAAAAGSYNDTGNINMVAGEIYRIEAWHHENAAGASAALDWLYSGQTQIAVPTENLATDPSVFSGTCPLGVAARCAAGNAYEIKLATGTNMDGMYWIDINGTPTLTYCIMNSAMSGGGWMLAMKGKKASSTYNYASSYWTNTTTLNETYPERWKTGDTNRDIDAKYGVFGNKKINQILALYPEQSGYAGGAIAAGTTGNTSVPYGFSWLETTTAGRTWTSADGDSWNVNSSGTGGPNGTSCVTTATTLTNLFTNSARCAFRKVSATYSASETPYSAIGNGLFYSQVDIRFFGINYANNAGGALVRFGFGWNENGATNEASNDGSGGIGMTYGSFTTTAGSINGCCQNQAGISGASPSSTNIPFEMYVRNSTQTQIYGNNLRVTYKRANSLTAGNGFGTSATNGSNTFRLSPMREGFSIDPSTGKVTVSEAVAVGDYSMNVSVTDTDGVTGIKSFTVQVLSESKETDTALSFDGSSQYSVTTGTYGMWGDQTYEAWVKPGGACSQDPAKSTVIGTNNFALFCKLNYWFVSFKNSAGTWANMQTSQRVVTGAWIHIAVVRSGTTVTAYMNNNQVNFYNVSAWVSSYTQSTIYNVYGPLYLGGTGTAGEYFNGTIDEVKMWDSARTLSQIWVGANTLEDVSSPTLYGYWDFNEGSGFAITRSQRLDNNFSFTPNSANQWVSVATTSLSGPYTVVSIPRTLINIAGGWRAPDSITAITALVLGGGGGGGGGLEGGGGGGGGFIETQVAISPKTVYPIKVGVGGAGSTNPWRATSGDTSTAFGLSALGGGAGASEFDVSGVNVQYPPSVGGSGGGGNWGNYLTGAAGTAGQGFAGGSSSLLESPNCSPSQYVGAGGGGAGGTGFNASCTKGGNGGAAKLSAVLGTYVGGGGGGSLRSATSATNIGYGSNNAVNNGGNSGYVSGALVYATGGATNGNPGTGTGGGAGLSTNGSTGYGADGGSGTVTFRYITAFKPTFTQPTIAYLNAGMTETFTTNVAQDSATAVLTRTFRWESTTAGAGGTYSLIKQGTGAANAAFSWVPTDTSTSGSQFLYRVIVTDSDSSGLFIQDTSTAVYAVINRALVLTSKTTLTKTVNVSKTETFTVSLGTPTYSYTLTPTSPNFWLDTSTVGSPRIKFADTVTVGTYYETFTVTDSVSASIVVPLTIVVSPPPSFSASAQQVDSGTVLYLDAGNSSSYPGSGSAWTDLSGRAIATSLTQTFSSTQIAADGSTRSGATMVSNCAAPTYSAEALGVLNFNGTSQCAYASGMGVQSSYTVELWVKRNGAQTSWASTILTNPYRFASDQLNISIFWIGTDTLGAGVYQYPGGWKTLTGFFIEDATWVHISVSMNNGVLRMMKNANTTTSQSLDTTYTTWNKSIMDNGLLIGQRWGDAATTAGWFKGSLASTRIYGRVLSDSEIAQNYNATKGRFLLTQNKQAQVGKYGTRYSDTFTVTSGSETLTSAWSNTSLTQIMWDTSTARTLVLTAQESLTPGTYYDTITVTDIYGASTRLPLTYTIAKADTITVSMDTATVTVYNTLPLVKYPKPVIKGLVNSDTFTVTTKFSSTLYALSSTVPTNADTYTVIAADPVFTVGNSSYYLSIIYETSTAIINKARQTPLNVSMYGAIIGSPFTITLLGGSGDGVVTESLTGTSTAPNCVISSHVLTSSATQISYCQLLVTKAGTQNYFLESSTVQIYFMGFTINQPTNQFGSGSGIALNGATAITRDAQAAPYISEVVWVPLTCLGQVCDRAHWEIRGSGFGLSDNSQTVVKFWRNQVVTLNQSYYAGTRVVTDTTIIIAPEDVPAGATTGKITVTTANGIAISPTNWIAP